MFIKDLENCQEFIAGDNSILKELLHPEKDPIDIRFSLAYARVKPGDETYKHKLKTSEVYYIINGTGIMHIDDEEREVFPHQAIYIPPRSVQWIKSIGDEDLVFISLVDPAWQATDEEVCD
ncbi:MAG: cupin domain-containing protein [bacterium]|nr:cupin domain-containing protein [bacterium]